MTILQKIEDEIKRYDEISLKSNPSFAPRQQDVLNLINLQWISKFRDGETDDLGFKKVFYNINNFPVEVSSKMLDIDTKDILLTAEDWSSYWPAWLLSKELKMWMKDNYFSRQLNEYCFLLPKYGHIFVKKVQENVITVPLGNLIFRADADDLSSTPVIEKHEYDPDYLTVLIEEKGWDKPNKLEINSEGKSIVYEAYYPEGFLKEETKNYFIINGQNVLAAQKETNSPYKDLAWEKIPGRLLGRGIVEKLFESQIYLNRIANYKAEGLHWTSKHLFQTRDTNIESDVMTEVSNGYIFKNTHPLEPVVNEERNLAAYGSDENKWLENAFKMSFTREPITGGRAPSGTPLGSTVIQQQMASDYFEQKKEELGSFIKEILNDWVIPEFKNQKRKEHKILIENLLSEESSSEQFFNLLVQNNFRKRQANLAKKGTILDASQKQIMKGLIAEKLKGKEFEVPKGLYDNIKYKTKIIITGEQLDVGARQTTLQTIFQIIGSNPTVLQDKTTRKVFNRMIDLAGINPKDLGLEEMPTGVSDMAGQAKATRGGSIASPSMPASPQMAATPTAI